MVGQMRSVTAPFCAAGIAASLILAAPLVGQPPAPVPAAVPAGAEADSAETIGYLADTTRRMTVPVNIAGRGPYDFVVDTGSERTVISSELARELALGPGRTAVVHSMTEVSRIATVVIPGLRFGARTIADIHAPSLARRNLGAVGMLGVDSLQRQRVVFDFERREMTIMPSRIPEAELAPNEVVVTGRNRFGRLMLVDASIDGQRVYVIIDTGSQVTVANGALRRQLERRNRLGRMFPIELTSVTGGRMPAEYTIAREMQIGGVDIRNMPIAFADVHPFRQLGLENRPAILLGMDALQLFDRVSVDFANRRVRLLRPDSSMLTPAAQMARAAIPPVRN
jgi:predicted aspartyl protease